MWILYALASAFFAALTSVLAKLGLDGINSNLATAIRTAVVLIMSWGIVRSISSRGWLFLILSGAATGFSWLFYYRALAEGNASVVVPIDKFSVVIAMILSYFVLHETLNAKSVIGGILITAGTLVMIL